MIKHIIFTKRLHEDFICSIPNHLVSLANILRNLENKNDYKVLFLK